MQTPLPNPILPGMHPDPTVCRVGQCFYLANSSFGQFPGVPLYRSRDLRNWEYVRHILSRPEQLPFVQNQKLGNAGIFAPTLRYHDGTIYLITTMVGSGGHFIVTTKAPEDEWSDPIWLGSEHQGGIDPSLTFLSNGSVLFQSTADSRKGEPQGIIQFEINPQNGYGLTPRTFLTMGFGGKATEGPHIFQRGKYWYLLTAEGGTETAHRVSIGRSDSAWGPWEPCPHNPILSHAGIDSPIQNTGHADMFDDSQGNWWMVFLGVRPQGYPPVHLLGRETFITQVKWTDDDWPIVNEGKPVELELCNAKRPHPWSDSFKSTTNLHHRWATIGRSYRDVYDLTGQGIQLIVQADSLSKIGKQGWIGTRMTQLSACYEVELRIESPETEVGLAAYQEAFGYFSLGINENPSGDADITFRQRVIDIEKTTHASLPRQATYRLRMQLSDDLEKHYASGKSCFIFSAMLSDGSWTQIAQGASRLLSTEVIGGFGGLFAAAYCVGKVGATARVLNFACRESE
ncbi:glycoside hydrolase family 43 protein [Cerasicoccus frondis]|uniref:glycoside hydrolase family 43 protein n=1 Tax=Cerasicoccus frondis TaxID=490090 RepID=UPI0028528487|nr:family 43 glycosylhydrolase [Cerasicoccus frondis]